MIREYPPEPEEVPIEGTDVPTVINVWNITDAWARNAVLKDPKYLYIGRRHEELGLKQSKWANPFKLQHHSRAKALRLYKEWIADPSHL